MYRIYYNTIQAAFLNDCGNSSINSPCYKLLSPCILHWYKAADCWVGAVTIQELYEPHPNTQICGLHEGGVRGWGWLVIGRKSPPGLCVFITTSHSVSVYINLYIASISLKCFNDPRR